MIILIFNNSKKSLFAQRQFEESIFGGVTCFTSSAAIDSSHIKIQSCVGKRAL